MPKSDVANDVGGDMSSVPLCTMVAVIMQYYYDYQKRLQWCCQDFSWVQTSGL